MRRAAKIDENQTEIVEALEKFGATVQTLGQVGDGCPDLLVGYRHKNLLIEVKNPKRYKKMNSVKALNEDQQKWHFFWQGQVDVVWTIDEAINLLRGEG